MSSSSYQLSSNTLLKYSDYEYHIRNFDENFYYKNKNMNNDSIFDDKIENFCNFIII